MKIEVIYNGYEDIEVRFKDIETIMNVKSVGEIKEDNKKYIVS
mgnify:CR=1 FL=1